MEVVKMNKFTIILFSILFMLIIPTIGSAQPAPPPPGAYYVVEQCYTVLFPYPHSKCEYVRVRRNYTPALPLPLPHRMGPPPMRPRPGHHPPPP